MKNLVYKFVRTLNPEVFGSNINYLYKDNYVHCRLGIYGDKKQRISGFESKLAFLLTFMMNESVNKHLSLSKIQFGDDKENYQEIWNQCLGLLKSMSAYQDLEYTLEKTLIGFKGIKILPMYSLKHKPKNAYELLGICKNMSSKVDLNYLLDVEIKDDLYGFLFDENFEILIEEESVVDNSKFIRKHKEKKEDTNLWKIWEALS